jgi:beta-phosphoglucomutase-like phosphatase (HAD superfamily)
MGKAILFDMDGVIVDTDRLHFESYKQMVKELSLNLTKEEYKSTFSGKTATHGVSDSFNDHGVSADIETAVRRKIAIFHELSMAILCHTLPRYAPSGAYRSPTLSHSLPAPDEAWPIIYLHD